MPEPTIEPEVRDQKPDVSGETPGQTDQTKTTETPAATPPNAETTDDGGQTTDVDATPPATPPNVIDDPLLESLMVDLGEKKIEPVPEPETTDDGRQTTDDSKDKKPEPKPDDKAPEPKKKKSKILDKAPLPELGTDQGGAAAPPHPAAAAPAAPAPNPDEEYVKGLPDEVRDEIAEAQWAEKNLGEKYKGRAKKLIDWYRTHDTKASELRTAKPDRTFGEDDEDYQSLLKTKPRFDALDYKKIQRGMIEENVTEKVRKESEGKLAEVERKQKEIELKPAIDSVVSEFTTGLTSLLDDKADWRKTIKERPDAAAEFKMEESIREAKTAEAADLAREYTRFANQLSPFDASNPKHKWLLDFINRNGEYHAAHGGDARVRDGKTFVPRLKWAELARTNPEALKNHWTFSHRDVLTILALNTQADIERAIETERNRLKELGFERKPKAPSAQPPKPDPQPLNPPKAKPTPAKGAAEAPKPKVGQTQADTGIDVIATLGLGQ